MSDRPKGAYQQAAELFEPAAAALLKNPDALPIEAGALASIAISLRRLADAGIFSMGALVGSRSQTMNTRDAAEIAVAADRETWEAAIRLAQERKGN